MQGSVPGEITQLLGRIRQGDRAAVSDLAGLAYPELKRLATACLRRQGPEHTWMPTDLVNELWVRLLRRESLSLRNRSHFLGVAAHLMRVLLVDHARAKSRSKRTRPDDERDGLAGHLRPPGLRSAELVAVNEALSRLAELSPRQAQIVEMRYFAGFTVEETADAMGISSKTVKRDWAAARVWLHAALTGKAI